MQKTYHTSQSRAITRNLFKTTSMQSLKNISVASSKDKSYPPISSCNSQFIQNKFHEISGKINQLHVADGNLRESFSNK